MYVFICENSIDGIFTAIYDAWASRRGHNNITLTTREPENYELFQEYIHVTTEPEKSQKVSNTLQQRLGLETYSEICEAACALDESSRTRKEIPKADAIYKTVVLALSMKDGSKVLECLGNPYVNRTFQLSRSTFNEAHHLLGFLRFQELENGVLFARIHPKNDVLAILADHFCDRLPQEHFMIYDDPRQKAALHRKGTNFLITGTDGLDEQILHRFSPQELEYQKLWCGFFESITIESRKNPGLQRQNLPKRFRQDIVEFSSPPP